MALEKLIEVTEDMECSDLLRQILHLRFKVDSEIGLVKPEDFPTEEIGDKFDELPATVHFVIIKNSKVIGVTRIVEYTDKYGLPFDEGLTLDYFLKGLGKTKEDCLPIIYGSRLRVDRSESGKGIGKWLLVASHLYAAYQGAKYAFGCKNPDYSFFQMIGYDAIGEERKHEFGSATNHNLLSVPAVQDLEKLKNSRVALIAEERTGYFFRGFPF